MSQDPLTDALIALEVDHRERVCRLAGLRAIAEGVQIFERALVVFGNQTDAALWLTTERSALEGAIPVDLAVTADGRERIANLMLQIEYGVYV